MLKPRESIAALEPYRSLIASREGLSLDLNENQAGCSPRVLARLRTLGTADIARYPQREIGERLVANFLGVNPEAVLLTNGVDETLCLLFATYLREGCELLFSDPTFVMYPMFGQAFGAQLVRVPAAERLCVPGRGNPQPHFAADPTDRDRQPEQSHGHGCRTRRLAAHRGGCSRRRRSDRRGLFRVLRRNGAC